MASSAGHFGGCLKVDIPRLAMIARLDAEETAVVDVDMDMCIAIRAIAFVKTPSNVVNLSDARKGG